MRPLYLHLPIDGQLAVYPDGWHGPRPEYTYLVTGGTGTFGHAMVRRLLDDKELYARRVIVYSRDELKQQQMAAEFGHQPRLRFLMGDVRDKARLIRALQGVDVVFHAAALKQLTRADEFDEMTKTNILGSWNVAEACVEAGVSRCVGLSSDKACAATTPYGASKACMEWLFIAANAWGDSRFSCTRYGNVIGSRGSILEIWADQAAYGDPITLTDPQMTRFWMTIEQAVDLVLLALERMEGGEIFIPKGLDRGYVSDFAYRHFPGAEIQYTGKRSYEKQVEELITAEEADRAVDVGDAYILLPHPAAVHWEPEPYGFHAPPVNPGFRYASDSTYDPNENAREG